MLIFCTLELHPVNDYEDLLLQNIVFTGPGIR